MGSLNANIAIAIGAAIMMASAAAQTPPQTTAPAQTTTEKSPFPPGPGREALFKVCNDCHGPESVLGQLKTREEWSKTLDEMSANGAQGTDEEWNSILEYLDKNYSLIMVNTAAAKDLASKLDVPTETADAIVRIRTEKGKFKSIDDLKQVPGLDATKLDARKDRLVF